MASDQKVGFVLISFLPAGSEEKASSRIRVYTLQRALAQNNIQTVLGYSPEANILLIQKRVNLEILRIAQHAHKCGRIILYDIDDLGGALWHWTPPSLFADLLLVTDVMLVATEAQRDILRAEYNISNIEVLPNSIDYYPTEPAKLYYKDSTPLRILWFGGARNLYLLEKYIFALTSLPDVEILVATDISGIGQYSRKYPYIKFINWELSQFIPLLQSCHLTCLMHDGTKEDRAKSNNRMVTSIAWGIPAVVTNTFEYQRTALAAGINFALFKNGPELQAVIEHLRPGHARKAYIDLAQPWVWDHYAPNKIAQTFIRILKKHIINHRNA